MSTLTALAAIARMDAAREDAAGRLLGWDRVAEQISTAAGKGLGLVVVAPPPGVSIRHTKAAADLVKRLGVAKFTVSWRDRRDPDDVPNYDLVVSWPASNLGLTG